MEKSSLVTMTPEQEQKSNSSNSWIVIDGYCYDTAEFRKRHPGGNVIRYYDGMDATDVFHALHFRSEKAKKMLATLPRKPVTPEHPDDSREPLIKDFRKLRQDLVNEGAFKPTVGMQILRTLELILWYGLAIYLCRIGHWFVGGLVR